MTPAQQRLYWREWSHVRKHLIADGWASAKADAERHALHRKAIGYDKSSKKFGNSDLDKVIAVFRAVWDGGNLNAQLRQLDQGQKRSDVLRARIVRLAEECGVADGVEGIEAYFQNWFKGRTLAGLGERELQQLAGILERRKKQLPEPVAAEEGQPF